MPPTNPSMPPSSSARPPDSPAAPSDAHPPTVAVIAASAAMRLLSKSDVCAIYGISVRCLENWIRQGRVPAPTSIGGRRYWHPDSFYRDLAATMGAVPPAVGETDAGQTAPSATPRAAKKTAKKPAVAAAQHPAATSLLARQDSAVEAMNRRLGLID